MYCTIKLFVNKEEEEEENGVCTERSKHGVFQKKTTWLLFTTNVLTASERREECSESSETSLSPRVTAAAGDL